MSEPSKSAAPSHRSKRRRRVLLALGVLAVVVGVAHPYLLAGALRAALTRVATAAGLKLELGDIEVSAFRPIILRDVRLRALDPSVWRMAADARQIEVALNFPWEIFAGDRRVVRSVSIQALRGVLDFRPGAMPAMPRPQDLTPAEEKVVAARVLMFLPQAMAVGDTTVEVLADNQSYYVEEVVANFNEDALGTFRCAGAEVYAAGLHENLGPLHAITAWRNGALYLADLAVRDGVKVENFSCDLVRPGGIALDLDASIFGGAARGNVSFGFRGGVGVIDAAVWASGIRLPSVARFLGIEGEVEGIVRESRLTFRGAPDRILDGQASLRLVLDGFRWKERGWQSLEVGASLSQRLLAVSEFSLQQKDNTVRADGEVHLGDTVNDLTKAPFSLNLSASIRDLRDLAGLLGKPFDEMSGRMSLNSSVTGQGGAINGFLTMEASGMEFRGRPINSGKAEVTLVNGEARVDQLEFWSDQDYVRGKGSFDLAAPHHYSGEVQGRVEDLAPYLALFPTGETESIYAGAVQVRWQGDGNFKAHSGAFHVSLDDFVSQQTPSGLTGRFAGTYSPQNVYFSGFELAQNNLRFSTRATLAESGVKLQDAVLRAGNREVADGEVFLPVNPFALAAGKPLGEAVHREALTYVHLATRGALKVRDLLALSGNDGPASGTLRVNLSATGRPTALTMDGVIEGRGLGMSWDGGRLPPSTLDAKLRAADGEVRLEGALKTGDFPPATLSMEAPFGFVEAADKSWRWMNPDGRLHGKIEIPKIDLGLLRPFLPRIHRLTGALSGGLAVGGTASSPKIDGRLTLDGGLLQTAPRAPEITGLNGLVTFNGDRIAVEKFAGAVAAGPFELSGAMTLGGPGSPNYDFTFHGEKILLARDPGLRLRANIDLHAAGGQVGGALTGSVRLVDGRLYQRLEITPLIVPAAGEEEVFVPPRLEGLVPAPFAAWKLDVDIRNETPFEIVGNIATGEIVPDLSLTGTLGNPLPIGRVEIFGARAFLPFTTMTITEGTVDFIATEPWMPQLNVRAVGQAMDYEVQAFAFGPLNQRRLILRSDPPLPQQSLILLLTTGITPGIYAGAGFGEAAAGQGGLLLLRAFARQFETQGVDVDSIINRLQITAVPPQYQGDRSSLRGRFRLWQGLSLMSERDSYGFYNAGVTYNFRFR